MPPERQSFTVEQLRQGACHCEGCGLVSIGPDGDRYFHPVTAARADGRLAYWCPDHAPTSRADGETQNAVNGAKPGQMQGPADA